MPFVLRVSLCQTEQYQLKQSAKELRLRKAFAQSAKFFAIAQTKSNGNAGYAG